MARSTERELNTHAGLRVFMHQDKDSVPTLTQVTVDGFACDAQLQVHAQRRSWFASASAYCQLHLYAT